MCPEHRSWEVLHKGVAWTARTQPNASCKLKKHWLDVVQPLNRHAYQSDIIDWPGWHHRPSLGPWPRPETGDPTARRCHRGGMRQDDGDLL